MSLVQPKNISSSMTLGKESHGVQLAMQGIASVGDEVSTAPIEGNVSNDIQQ